VFLILKHENDSHQQALALSVDIEKWNTSIFHAQIDLLKKS